MTLEPNQDPERELPLDLNQETLPPTDQPPTDEATQDAYRKAYIEQLRRLSCPGCGEDFTLF